ncbi:hypothetical protein EAI_12930 [Harpegnathos saltator]|uniref:SAP domain-containing protein n=1 Tax=Harpegnathos saltator TaxID=610380 RepID=E2BTP8_HARSA|nr:hypothetical protein EAI_12930 [Harpegnathos saltator]
MSTVTVADLKKKLKSRNLPTTGSKAGLVRRLLDEGVLPEELRATKPASNGTHEVQTDEPRPGTSVENVISTAREIELLRKERDLTEREAEILRRELDLLRMAPRREENVSGRIGVRKWQDLKDLIGEFSGGELDYDRWEKQAKALLASYDLDQNSTKNARDGRFSTISAHRCSLYLATPHAAYKSLEPQERVSNSFSCHP